MRKMLPSGTKLSLERNTSARQFSPHYTVLSVHSATRSVVPVFETNDDNVELFGVEYLQQLRQKLPHCECIGQRAAVNEEFLRIRLLARVVPLLPAARRLLHVLAAEVVRQPFL
jgi:hypothetical protein